VGRFWLRDKKKKKKELLHFVLGFVFCYCSIENGITKGKAERASEVRLILLCFSPAFTREIDR
jgi:hypothetical protein